MRFLLAFVFTINCLFGQGNLFQLHDTTFFDGNWKACNSFEAKYYRIYFKNEIGYVVRDYYANYTLQMEAEANNINPLEKNGICTYYNERGIKISRGYYTQNKKTGVWWTYFKNGKDSVQEYIGNTSEENDITSWLPQNQSSLIAININYRANYNHQILNSGNGLGFELGLNLAYLFNQKCLIAPYIGIGIRDVFLPTNFSNNYKNDFNSNINLTNLSGKDSIVANQFYQYVNSNEIRFHETQSVFGLMLRLPYRWAPIIKLYKGGVSYSYKTGKETLKLTPYDPKVNGTDNDYYDISFSLDWGAEIVLYNGYTRVKPWDYTDKPRIKKMKLKKYINLFALSFFIQKYNFANATYGFYNGIDDVRIKQSDFLNPTFTNKYNSSYNFGLKMSCGLY